MVTPKRTFSSQHRATSPEYVRNKGIICPFCNAQDIDAFACRASPMRTDRVHDAEPEPNAIPRLYRQVKCYTCGTKFWEVYKLAGYEL